MVDYVKILQTVIESILTCTIFFVMARPTCHLYWKVIFTATFASVYVFGYAVLYDFPLIPMMVAILVLFSVLMNIIDRKPILDGSYCASLFLSHVVERFGTLLSGMITYFLVDVSQYGLEDDKLYVIIVWTICQLVFTYIIIHLPLFKETIHQWLGKGFNRSIILAS